jgi:hypothetical protein
MGFSFPPPTGGSGGGGFSVCCNQWSSRVTERQHIMVSYLRMPSGCTDDQQQGYERE